MLQQTTRPKTSDYNNWFGLAMIKHDSDQYPTYDSLPDDKKHLFARLEDGGYVQREAFELMQSVQGRTSNAMHILHTTAKKFEPIQLSIDKARKQIMGNF